MTNNAVELSRVAISFGKHVVHKNITFAVARGESVTILGPSGSGKTLLLKTIIGLLRPDSGSVSVLGQNLMDLSEDKLRGVRKNIGMLFQGAALFDSLTVFENVAYSLREYGETPEAQIRETVLERLELVGLAKLAGKFPSQLSGGQRKRVGLARALAHNPRIVLFDEPTTGLDPTATRMIDDLIIKLKEDYGISCISVTHDIASAKRISDRWLLINNGVVIAHGSVDDVSKNNREVIDFISGNWQAEMRANA